MTRAEEQQIILSWVYKMQQALEPKKRGPKTDEEIQDKQLIDEDGRAYHINGYRHKVYDD